MKNKSILIFVITFFTIVLLSFAGVYGQPPNPPGGHGLNGNQGSGGSASIDGGSLTLLFSVLGYGAYKITGALRKRKEADRE